ncbi:hypothetical protein NDU88_006694 [Pleurodeles waltl]|uniref:Uncharacterized protein n=1 Tax=Pleurodeles waltl TaxID=8319 RepID=A0AAV7U161_PLEWA|nr:hypothetical protein NDU88_006694 [Pleurodeles waltl]
MVFCAFKQIGPLNVEAGEETSVCRASRRHCNKNYFEAFIPSLCPCRALWARALHPSQVAGALHTSGVPPHLLGPQRAHPGEPGAVGADLPAPARSTHSYSCGEPRFSG